MRVHPSMRLWPGHPGAAYIAVELAAPPYGTSFQPCQGPWILGALSSWKLPEITLSGYSRKFASAVKIVLSAHIPTQAVLPPTSARVLLPCPELPGPGNVIWQQCVGNDDKAMTSWREVGQRQKGGRYLESKCALAFRSWTFFRVWGPSWGQVGEHHPSFMNCPVVSCLTPVKCMSCPCSKLTSACTSNLEYQRLTVIRRLFGIAVHDMPL